MLHGSASTPSRQLRSRRWRAHLPRSADGEHHRRAGPAGHDGRDDAGPRLQRHDDAHDHARLGQGDLSGSTATVHATGVVKESGQKFWSTKDPGQEPFTYQAGVGGVIKGWDQGCLGMKVGEARGSSFRRTGATARPASRPGASRRADAELHPRCAPGREYARHRSAAGGAGRHAAGRARARRRLPLAGRALTSTLCAKAARRRAPPRASRASSAYSGAARAGRRGTRARARP